MSALLSRRHNKGIVDTNNLFKRTGICLSECHRCEDESDVPIGNWLKPWRQLYGHPKENSAAIPERRFGDLGVLSSLPRRRHVEVPERNELEEWPHLDADGGTTGIECMLAVGKDPFFSTAWPFTIFTKIVMPVKRGYG